MLFSWYIVAYLFLAGAGSGAFLIAATCCMGDALRKTEASERLVLAVQGGFYAAPCLVVLAGVFLLLDVGNVQRVWAVVAQPFQSVLSVGAWLVALLAVLSGALAVAGLVLREVPRPLLWTCIAAGWFCAAGVMSYTGLLLSDMVSIDLWHTPWLVALFVASSLSCGLAVVVGMDALVAPPSRTLPSGLWRAGVLFGCLEALVLAVFVVVQLGFTETAHASCLLLLEGSLAPAFWGGVCLVGIALPLAAHGAGHLMPRRIAALVSSAGVLVGGLFLRYCVVAAALYTPLALAAI